MFQKVVFLAGVCLFFSGKTTAQKLSEVEKLDAKIITLENSVKLLQKFKVSGNIRARLTVKPEYSVLNKTDYLLLILFRLHLLPRICVKFQAVT